MSVGIWKTGFWVTSALTGATTFMLVWGPLAEHAAGWTGAVVLERGNTSQAIARLERVVAERPTGRARYQLASALLQGGQAMEAAGELELALSAGGDPDLRRRILHNLALARLLEAMGSPPGARTPPALASVVAGREALRLDPDARATRLNLALAERLVSRSGAAGDPAPDSTRDNGGRPLGVGDNPESGRSLTRAQARALLDALASSEGSDISKVLERLFREGGLSLAARGPRW